MKLSVAMCTFNGARYLPEQLESIRQQTRPPDELIICDDGSSDATQEVINSFAGRAPFAVRSFVNEWNLGAVKNFEGAIGRCGGDVILLADQDDVWHPQKLMRCENLFAAAPGVGAVFTNATMIDERSRSLERSLWQYTFDPRLRREFERGRAFNALLQYSVVTGATLAFRSQYRNLITPIPVNAHVMHDGWIALMVAAVSAIGFIDEPLISYRQHPGQHLGARPQVSSHRGEFASADSRRMARAARRDYFRIEVEKLEAVYERLSAAKQSACGSDSTRIASRLAYVRGLAAHLEARRRMPEWRFGRLPFVFQELASLRYHIYAKGFYSAAKDLLI